ncbi:hypothetical protein BKA69DRAFT_783796 [Paraphysoderma sedebokerense]|nr:hypothetical protein BKA69DRAFT_783796 [Paraphysoderma sedebokerense]
MPDRLSLLSQRSIKKWIFRRGTYLIFFGAALVVALIGTGIGLACFFILRTSETAMFQKDLRHGCEFRASILEDTFNTTIIQLGRYFSAFILTQQNLTAPTFANFAQLTFSPSVPIFGAGFATLITSTQRAEWQNRFQRNLTYIGPSFELLPIGPEEREHFPMGLFYSPRPANLIGLDYFATPERAAPARKALETGKPAISDVIPLTLSRNSGFMMFYPVFNYTFDQNFTRQGAVTFAFELSKVIDSNFENTLPTKIGTEILAPNSSFPSQKEVIWHSTLNDVHYIDSEMINLELPVFDRVWCVVFGEVGDGIAF